MPLLRYGALIALSATLTLLAAPQRPTLVLMPVADVKPGMVGIGRTIFLGDRLEDFKVEIMGTLDNVIGPRRRLILARLSGGPLAETGVIAGMSGSPVYIDGKLIGAISYALGSFPKEPIAGITPIGEMLSDVDAPATNGRPERAASTDLALRWPAAPADVFSALRRFTARAASPISAGGFLDPRTLGPLDPSTAVLRPIGAAFSVRGFDGGLADDLTAAFGAAPASASSSFAPPSSPALQSATAATLRPGDAVGAGIMRGDLEMGATGTVTHVDGTRIYAFGHPFLALGPTQMAMTKARVYGVLPSLQSSMKIADLGPVIGTMTQDRATAMGGTLGMRSPELAVTLTLNTGGAGAPSRRFTFYIAHDAALTPLFAYVSMLNVLTSYQRQTGVMTIGITGTASFGAAGRVTIDDVFSGENALVGVANTVLQPLSAMMNNEWRMAAPDTLDLTLNATESRGGLTIDRAWLDTSRPQFGATHTLHVLLRNFRGQTETRSLPIMMPSGGPTTLTLVVADAPALQALEQKELDPSAPKSISQLVDDLNATRRNNRLYVRLLASSPGTIVGGKAQPALPGSTRSIIDTDKSTPSSAVTRTIVGAWEERFDKVVRGSRELTLTLRQPDR